MTLTDHQRSNHRFVAEHTASQPPAPSGVVIPQYSKRSIYGIWAAAAVPMAALAWVVAPHLASSLHGSVPLQRALLLSLTAGLVWQFVLVAALVGLEQHSLRWTTLREALWLRAPRSPRTGRRFSRKSWLIVLVLVVALAAEQAIPIISHPANRDFGVFLGSKAGHAFIHGSWAWFALILVEMIFNTVLGEELLFRGFLLPRMNGAFGERDWIANGVLFAAYHLHEPWVIPAGLFDTLIIAGPTKRYRSAWIGIAVHSAQSIFFAVVLLTIVV